MVVTAQREASDTFRNFSAVEFNENMKKLP